MRSWGYKESPYDSRDMIFSAPEKVENSGYILENLPSIVDQGPSPICAAVSLYNIINWQNKAKDNGVKVKFWDIYDLRDDKSMQGMVPRQALSALKKEGVDGYKIKAYARVDSIEDAKFALLINGPLLAGFIAYNEGRFWEQTGPELGGHAVTLTGFNKDGFILRNSWGTDWMSGGETIFPYSDWEKVLECWTIMI